MKAEQKKRNGEKTSSEKLKIHRLKNSMIHQVKLNQRVTKNNQKKLTNAFIHLCWSNDIHTCTCTHIHTFTKSAKTTM